MSLSDVDGSVVVEERRDAGEVVRRGPGLELEPVVDVGLAVAVVVDLDLVADGRVEREEVRTAGRLLERDVVGDDRQLRRVTRVEERVQVGVVGRRIVGDERRFAVARCHHPAEGCGRDDQGAAEGDDLGPFGHGRISGALEDRTSRVLDGHCRSGASRLFTGGAVHGGSRTRDIWMTDRPIGIERRPGRVARAVHAARGRRSARGWPQLVVAVLVALVRASRCTGTRSGTACRSRRRRRRPCCSGEVRGQRAVEAVDDRSVAVGDGAELDVGDVVEEATAVREAAQVGLEDAQPARECRRSSSPKTQAPAAFGLIPVLTRSSSASVVPVLLRLIGPPTSRRSRPVSRIATRSSRPVVRASGSVG